jgi:drug/metabolite transporter (DMT)-like permease
MTGTLGNLAPLFAVALAFVILGEALRVLQLGGLLAIVAGIAVLTATRGGHAYRWHSWYLLLPRRVDSSGSWRSDGATGSPRC